VRKELVKIDEAAVLSAVLLYFPRLAARCTPLQRIPARITVTSSERQRLLKFGAKLGSAIRQLITIVTPDTFLRWIREESGRQALDVPPWPSAHCAADPPAHHPHGQGE
jgi:hypothetical protein